MTGLTQATYCGYRSSNAREDVCAVYVPVEVVALQLLPAVVWRHAVGLNGGVIVEHVAGRGVVPGLK